MESQTAERYSGNCYWSRSNSPVTHDCVGTRGLPKFYDHQSDRETLHRFSKVVERDIFGNRDYHSRMGEDYSQRAAFHFKRDPDRHDLWRFRLATCFWTQTSGLDFRCHLQSTGDIPHSTSPSQMLLHDDGMANVSGAGAASISAVDGSSPYLIEDPIGGIHLPHGSRLSALRFTSATWIPPIGSFI